MTNKQWMFAILLFWLVMFVGYVWWQERNITTGTKVWLQTRPVDPRDFFRGDYVILGYDISNACDLPEKQEVDEYGNVYTIPQYRDDSDMTGREKYMGGKRVYVPLIQSGDVMVASGCLTQKPDSWMFIAWVHQRWWGVLYGLEKYFVQEWTGKPLEEALWTMNVQVSIGKNGQARIVDYKFD